MVIFQQVGLRYGLGPEVLRDVSFELVPGSFHFLTGASGAGKSSLLSLLYLARVPSRGTVHLFGRDVARVGRAELPGLRRRIGTVFQDFRLLDHLSVVDNVALPPTLSGGQKQRVAIARAIIGRPQLLIADEPTGNVDDRIAIRLMRLFEELNRLGTTIVIATHNLQLVRESRHPELRLDDGTLSRHAKAA